MMLNGSMILDLLGGKPGRYILRTMEHYGMKEAGMKARTVAERDLSVGCSLCAATSWIVLVVHATLRVIRNVRSPLAKVACP